MRQINYIVIHCTATGQSATIESIQKYWSENLGWKSPGYHYIIDQFGTVTNLLPIEQISNGVAGYNHCTINVAYIGGVDRKMKAVDNRTMAQKDSMAKLVRGLKLQFPNAAVVGHRDFPNVKKDCPCFDASKWYNTIK